MKNVLPAIDYKNDMLNFSKLDSKGNDIDQVNIRAEDLYNCLSILVLMTQTNYDQFACDIVSSIVTKIEKSGSYTFKNYLIEVEERRFDLDIQFLTLGFCEAEYYEKQDNAIASTCFNCQNLFIHHLDTGKGLSKVHCSQYDKYCYEQVNEYYFAGKYDNRSVTFSCTEYREIV